MATIKTIKLKRATVDSEPAPAADTAPGAEPQAPAPSQASPAPSPVASAHAKGGSAKSYLPYMLFALLVVTLFAVIMGLQYAETSFYQAEPSVWVKK